MLVGLAFKNLIHSATSAFDPMRARAHIASFISGESSRPVLGITTRERLSA